MIISDMFCRSFRLSIAIITFGTGVFSWHVYRASHDLILPVPVLESATASAELAQPFPDNPQALILLDPRRKGIVLVQSRTDITGRVIEAVPLGGDEGFNQRAVEATYKMRFARQKYKGYHIGTVGYTTYKFRGANVKIYQFSRAVDDGKPLGTQAERNN